MFVECFMVFLFLVCAMLSMICYSIFLYGMSSFLLSVGILSLGGLFWWVKVKIDYITLLIDIMLTICFVYVLEYTTHYFSGDSVIVNPLTKMICLFVGVMFILVSTGDYLSSLVFWEYLGTVSFFLILFYGSYLSLRSSIITLVSSRFGDVCLFILIGYSLFCQGNSLIGMFLFFFIVFTKRAGFPFIRWLLEAMRAPTPVSSLVHSSTLVAAGIWFIMRYNLFDYFNYLLYFRGLLIITIFITGVCRFFFIDLKKIVALSTCKKISWCIFYLIFGDVCLALFQLVSHGVAKCMLFILVGDVMSGRRGSQASNCIYSSPLYGKWNTFSIISVVLGLSGVPFIGVFFTKHAMLTAFEGIWKICLWVLILICVFLSYFYSFRLCAIILKTKACISLGVLFFFNIWMLIYLWLFVGYFMRISLDEYRVLSQVKRLLLIVFQITSCVIAYLFYDKNIFIKWRRRLFGSDRIVELFYYVYNIIPKIINLFVYRWDNYVIKLFNRIGKTGIVVYGGKILKILVFLVMIFLMWFVILY